MDILARVFEHNDWATRRVIEACSALTPEQLDAKPDPASSWSIREAVTHLVEAQEGYLALLTPPSERRQSASPSFEELPASATTSGDGLRLLARGEEDQGLPERIQTADGYMVEPWVVLVQAVNHANDHRRQVCGMLRALGVTPPTVDGWSFGEAVGALAPLPT